MTENLRTEDLVFAVGDIHGRLDLVTAALEAIAGRAASAAAFRVIFLGDYIDRGPESRGVVELMMALSRDQPLLLVADSRSGDIAVIRTRDTNGPALFTMLPAGARPNSIAIKSFQAK